ncbi:MAG: hypothetical protein R2730_12945 [Chitinophagales bacterium]
MENKNSKYLDKNQLLVIAKENHIPDVYFDEVYDYYLKEIVEVEKEDGIDDKAESALFSTLDYFKKFDSQIIKGHSLEWAKLYASNIDEDEEAKLFNDAFLALSKVDHNKAIYELEKHCKLIGADELYTKHFIFLMIELEGSKNPSPHQQATSYSKIYNEQIALGRSNIFAHQYADLLASEDENECSCFTYAKYYEEAIQNGKSMQDYLQSKPQSILPIIILFLKKYNMMFQMF